MNEQEQNTLKLKAEPFDGGFTDMSKLIPNVFDRMIQKSENHETTTGIPTCFPSLDYYTSGLQRGDLIVVAGRPSMGKRYFVRDIAMHVALVNNLSVVMMDGEKSGEFQVMGIIASIAKTDYCKLRHSKTTKDAVDELKHSFSFLNDAPIYFSSFIPASVQELGEKLHQLSQRIGKPGLIVVDCLPELKLSGDKMNDDYAIKIAQSSRYLKAFAQELDVPIIVLSPIEQDIEKRCDKWPHITDLPGMAAIANAADLVLMMYWDEVYNPDSEEKGNVDIIVARNRNGFTGSFSMKFNDRYGTFEEIKHQG